MCSTRPQTAVDPVRQAVQNATVEVVTKNSADCPCCVNKNLINSKTQNFTREKDWDRQYGAAKRSEAEAAADDRQQAMVSMWSRQRRIMARPPVRN